MSLKEQIKNILDFGGSKWSYVHCNVEKRHDCYVLNYGAMYDAPTIGLERLMGLAELFGTTKIDVDDYSNGGCESCDYGSDYGHEIQIYDATKNVEELAALVGIDLYKD
jgi:hypothetical protein